MALLSFLTSKKNAAPVSVPEPEFFIDAPSPDVEDFPHPTIKYGAELSIKKLKERFDKIPNWEQTMVGDIILIQYSTRELQDKNQIQIPVSGDTAITVKLTSTNWVYSLFVFQVDETIQPHLEGTSIQTILGKKPIEVSVYRKSTKTIEHEAHVFEQQGLRHEKRMEEEMQRAHQAFINDNILLLITKKAFGENMVLIPDPAETEFFPRDEVIIVPDDQKQPEGWDQDFELVVSNGKKFTMKAIRTADTDFLYYKLIVGEKFCDAFEVEGSGGAEGGAEDLKVIELAKFIPEWDQFLVLRNAGEQVLNFIEIIVPSK